MSKKILNLILIFSLSYCLHAEGAGSTAAQFLEIQPGARASALGNAYVSLTDDGNSLYWNQSGLASITNSQVNLMHMLYFQNINYDYLAYSIPLRNIGVLSIGGLGLYTNGIDKTTEDSGGDFVDVAGDYNILQTAIMLGMGRKINNRLYAGVGIKLINEKIDTEKDSGVAFDIGSQYQIIVDKLRAGFVVQNLGNKIAGASLPASVKAGFDYKILNNLTTALECDYLFENSFSFGVGAEYILKDLIPIRIGYNTSAETGKLSKLSAGTGINLKKKIEIDYAFVPYGDIGTTHRLELTYRFDSKKTKEKNFDAKIDTMKEIPAAIYNVITERNIPVINIKMKNTSEDNKKFKIVYNIGIKKEKEEMEIDIAGGATRETKIIPTLTQEDIQTVTVMPTPSIISVEISQLTSEGNIQASRKEKFPVILLPFDQFTPQVVDANSKTYDMMNTLASWVTFNDRSLNEVISKASEKGATMNPPVKIVGFQPPNIFTRINKDYRSIEEKDKDYLSQIKLMYDTLKDDYKLTYVNNPIAYKNTQRIKLPGDTLKNKGNCIELAVLFASLLEGIEVEPILVILIKDSHATVGWRVSGDGKDIYNLLETNMFGEDFEKAISKGKLLAKNNDLQNEFANGIPFNEDGVYKKDDNVIIFDVKKIRAKVPPSPYIPR
ncbi:MAG: PorV/PorQ family protein [Elusimicrobia bacterium]|nr:PorV/PorQ family protein [Elusimicrobiota bacterium]